MFDIGAQELLLIVVVAILVIGPKDMPNALRHAGRWIGKLRRLSNSFRSGLDAMIREAEMEEMERKWQEQNEQIMREYPDGVEEEEPTGALPAPPPSAEDASPDEEEPWDEGAGHEMEPLAKPDPRDSGSPASSAESRATPPGADKQAD